MPTSTESDTTAIHRVLLDSGADPKLIHPAIEEIRHLSGQNVITALELRSPSSALRCKLRSRGSALRCKLKSPSSGLRCKLKSPGCERR